MATTPYHAFKALPTTPDLFSDSRTHGYKGPSRSLRFSRATPSGGGTIAKSEDGVRCVVAGRQESLRILRVGEATSHASTAGRGIHVDDCSHNFWDGSGLKIDSASTDVVWGYGSFSNKILTSARNGELIMWDLNKSGSTKYERRTKDHTRSISQISLSHVDRSCCITGSLDGDMLLWDLRELTKSTMRLSCRTSVRSVAFSPSSSQPKHAVAGLENGSIFYWDLAMGPRGLLYRLPVAHSSAVLSLDWCNSSGVGHGPSLSGTGLGDGSAGGSGWLASGGLDRCVKVWDLSALGAYTHKPTYVLHPSFPVGCVSWRPGYECELAIAGLSGGSADPRQETVSGLGLQSRTGNVLTKDLPAKTATGNAQHQTEELVSSCPPLDGKGPNAFGDTLEIWDVRRGWIAKWSISGTASDGRITDMTFGDSHAVWAQLTSGVFAQIDLRDGTKPMDSVTRVATSWEMSGSLAFVTDKPTAWEVPYDDIAPEKNSNNETRPPLVKTLAEPAVYPRSQVMGTFNNSFSSEDIVVFRQLAKAYVFEGLDRLTICARNAEIASQEGHDRAAHAWLLLGVCLSEYPICGTPEDTPHIGRQWSRTWEGQDGDGENAGQECDDYSSSPSPGSTDTEFYGEGTYSRSRSVRSKRVKSRSRSSTMASLPLPPSTRSVKHRVSVSSIRTVTAGDISFKDGDGAGGRDEDKKILELSWAALRESLDQFAHEGDVQMCALLSLVASHELGLSQKRTERFLNSYIELLNRLKLYACAAHLRKYHNRGQLRDATLSNTMIYTSCGKCLKTLKKITPPNGTRSYVLGGFSYCSTCRASSSVCAICRLPVKALFFHCSVCNHGGHQTCYRNYYMRHSMLDIPSPLASAIMVEPRVRERPSEGMDGRVMDDSNVSVILQSENSQTATKLSAMKMQERRRLVIRQCATGCGHHCWAGNADFAEQ